ncbi:hypothetical protein GO495_11685 [Chitinophaga oryziterrae]|uniref:tRNA_anti-like n=2 Tax=Chitinophaga oryziterrae TaxID=1031224 RepID=A0A6N8JA98_9BACT|nr:hypothetical protein [Chitinophaga oryziterrae]
MHMWKKTITILVILVIAGGAYGWYLYNKKPADIRKQTNCIELKATALAEAFNQDEAVANRLYVEKVLIVSGKVSNVQVDNAGHATVFLETGDPLSSITCGFYDDETGSVKKMVPGTIVRVKGNCTGKLVDVILNKCSLAE